MATRKTGRKPGSSSPYPLRGSYENQLDRMRSRRPHVFSVVQRGAMFDPGWARLFFELIGDLPPPTIQPRKRKNLPPADLEVSTGASDNA